MVYYVKNEEDYYNKVDAAGGKLVVVDFFAIWCSACGSVDPELAELSAKYANRIVVLKVDIDKFEDLAKQNNVESVPKFIFLNKGNVVSEFSGDVPGKLEETVLELTGIGSNSCPVRWS